MSADEKNERTSGQGDESSGLEIPKHQSPSEAGKDEEMPSYRKTEEDSTMLADEERTGEGTGAKAGEYS